ncbi:hypothetical protein CHLNCDRAFT_144153 [Chlorella variabilis]|uniref:PPM-type phosphatase domain-containing protein n=1 Tax=Chlorella variabilis TaxID=554065 RepID=E1ZC12_CHLVA|nr:hypothetical protein CHLNCDRAFT_144153 [Chlorella variabilis]EFN56528.1 hypothetical protein CHLNCDRAFT_144153 [Chlorella variabilis]|eukprot:XP_005848630.1 hypothetical protein CHLNCDRAFT_144153 [Chlorella variabilis]
MPQVLQHLEQLERIEAAAGELAAARGGRPAAKPSPAPRRPHTVSWVDHGASAAASLMEAVLSGGEEAASEEEALAALAALPPRTLTEAQQAALVMQAWDSAAHTKPAHFDADAALAVPGLAEVAVVSRGGWQRHSWKGCNQDSFLALPLAGGAAACQGCSDAPACCSPAVAVGVFDGHGRAGAAASAHLRNALASGLLMHSQLALMAQPACQPREGGQDGGQRGGQGGQGSGSHGPGAAAAAAAQQEEAAQLLERCFAAAASTMPSTGADFSLSGSTAVMCLLQPGSVTAAWAGDSRAVLGLCQGGRYIACALTHDHRPCSPLERARIEAAGGWVMQTMLDEEGRAAGPYRVYLRDTHIPGLAVSRCFGDYVAAGAGVTSTPDVTTLVLPMPEPAAAASAQQQQQQQQQQQGRSRSRRRPRSKAAAVVAAAAAAAHILIVASDGLWEFVGSAEAVRIASRCATAAAAAEALAQEARAHWAAKLGGAQCDDITVAVAFLPAAAAAGAPAGR